MRLIIVLLTTAILQVSASGYAQKITLSERNTPLEQVLKKIKAQSGYNVVYASESLEDAKKVSLQFNGLALETALEQVFKNQELSYEVKDKTIIIKEKSPGLVSVILNSVQDLFSAIDPRGKILDQNGAPLAGATVKLKGTNRAVITGKEGEFSLSNVPDDGVLIISYVGYKPLEISLKDAKMPLEIKLDMVTGELKEVDITYNTGYQKLKPNEVTGSITHITREQLQRSVSPNILDRLDGIAQGVLFDRRSGGEPKIQIRGQFSGLVSEEMQKPLIVVDNFQYRGNINDIDPNSVESIDILKDAAASSIWGAKAGNGVIVITTKQGKFNQKPQIAFSSNFNVTTKPDINKNPYISSSDYIDLETFLFHKGLFNSQINEPIDYPLSPVVELLSKMKNGTLDLNTGQHQIDELRHNDVRKDFLDFVYKEQISQQYSLNLFGGGDNIYYSFSGGFSGTMNGNTLKNNSSRRLNINSKTSYQVTKAIRFNIGLGYTNNNDQPNGISAFGSGYSFSSRDLYPYARLLDASGNPAIIEKDYKKSYTDGLGTQILDWNYRPLRELELNDFKNSATSFNIDLGTELKLFKGLDLNLYYNFQKRNGSNSKHYNKETYFTRNLINLFTVLSSNPVKYGIPKEGILDLLNSTTIGNNARGTLSYQASWNDKHAFSFFAGAEIDDTKTNTNSGRTYGYSDVLGTGVVDYATAPMTIFGYTSQVPSNLSYTSRLERGVSIFGNAAYTFRNRYTISGSARRDSKNIFGLKTNQKGRPFWSLGLAWDLNQETFYDLAAIPLLKLRLSYGYNGNYNPNGVARTVMSNIGDVEVITGLPYNGVLNYPNPYLRWEKVNQFNAGIDFGIKGGRITGSLEYWNKKSTDVFGQFILAPSTGLGSKTINSADISGYGFDANLSAVVIHSEEFDWKSSSNLAYVNYTITKYNGNKETVNNFLADGTIGSRAVGYNPYTISSYKWGGLDPLSGSPLGYVNGQISDDYIRITDAFSPGDIVMHGTNLPQYFGNFLNTFSYKEFSISTNITYGFNYFFRRSSVRYNNLFYEGLKSDEYSRRWKSPGDELKTNVPSLSYPGDYYRDEMYAKSEATIEKGDYISINDIQAFYELRKNMWKRLPFSSIGFGAQLTGLNWFVWRGSDLEVNPQMPTSIPNPLSIVFKLNVTF